MDRERLEQALAPHLDAAYNLARWLVRNDHDAADAVQEAYLRAIRFFGGFRGGDTRAWLLTIVRNTCYTWLSRNRASDLNTAFDEETHGVDSDAGDPQGLLQRKLDSESINHALEQLPAEFREIIVLRELEGMSYKDIAGVCDLPIGTVMSRLSRARKRLQQLLVNPAGQER